MTHTLSKRTHRTTNTNTNTNTAATHGHAHAHNGRVLRHDSEPGTDPADLAVSLRSLAVRADRALKNSLQHRDESLRAELHELRVALRRLEAELQTQQLLPMLPYVSSLRHRVEMIDC